MDQRKPISNRNSSRGTRNTQTTNDKKKKKKKWSKNVRWTFLIVTLVLSLTILIVLLIFNFKYGKTLTRYQNEAKDLVTSSDLDTFRQAETSVVYDAEGNQISTVKGVKDVYYIEYEDIPETAIDAMVSIEDKKFWEHGGIDLKANVRAFVALVKHRGGVTQGASTISQQLARNIFLTNEVSIERKLKEIFIAMQMEKKYSKQQIMEFYLNNIYFSNGYYGIQAASKGYFNKEVTELSLSQIAYLCAIPNNPTLYDPHDHPENTVKRRDRILYQMYKDGKISKEEYDSACNEKIKVVTPKTNKNNYVETYVYYSATRALMQQQGFEFRNEFKDEEDKENYEEEYSQLYSQYQKTLYTAGYRIYTSIDMTKQDALQKSVDDTLANYTDKNKEGTYKLQGAAVCIDNSTGRVVAIVGGRYQDAAGYTLNRAYQSYRQPGSSIKPLIVYTPTFENGASPEDIVVDKKFKGGPSNSNGRYAGKITIRSAVEQSKNTVAWQLFEKLTPNVGLSYLLKMNFAKLDKNDYYLATALGGFTNGVSPVEMTAGYATLENDGIYREPTCIVKILDSKGEELVSDSTAKKRIYKTNSARMMTDVLTGVIKNGTGKGLGLDNMPSAGKTGTTNEKKDGWFVGYTPYYTTGVWVGYDIPKAMAELSGATFPGTIWKTFMNQIHQGLENKAFAPYEDTGKKNETLDEATTEDTSEDTKEVNTTTEEQTKDKNQNTAENSSDNGEEQSDDGGWTENTKDDFSDSSDIEDSQDDSDTDTQVDQQEDSNLSNSGDEWSDEDSWNSADDAQSTTGDR